MNREHADWAALLKRWKYPLILLLAGLLLLLLPGGEEKAPAEVLPQEALAALLSRTQGVGEARVLISDRGVVVACAGAGSAEVRLDILRAVRSYTGFGTDKITILQLGSTA